MHFTSVFATLALVALGSASPTPAQPAAVEAREPAAWETTLCADLPEGKLPKDNSTLVWHECDKLEAMRKEKRISICDRVVGGNCGGPCTVRNSQSVRLNNKGTWWTRWCHAGGLHTQNKGSTAFVQLGHSTTVTWSGTVNLAGPVSKFLDASLGFEISKSKSVGQGAGCVNQDGKSHGVWFQELMGWADTTVTTTTQQFGSGCLDPGTHSHDNNVHADYPDPYNTGFRDLKAGCGSPDDAKTPWCNFDAGSLNM